MQLLGLTLLLCKIFILFSALACSVCLSSLLGPREQALLCVCEQLDMTFLADLLEHIHLCDYPAIEPLPVK